MRNGEGFYKQYWSERVQTMERAKARGKLTLYRHKGCIHVSAPKDMDFRAAMLALGAEWKPKLGVWSVASHHTLALIAAVNKAYACPELPEWLYQIIAEEGGPLKTG